MATEPVPVSGSGTSPTFATAVPSAGNNIPPNGIICNVGTSVTATRFNSYTSGSANLAVPHHNSTCQLVQQGNRQQAAQQPTRMQLATDKRTNSRQNYQPKSRLYHMTRGSDLLERPGLVNGSTPANEAATATNRAEAMNSQAAKQRIKHAVTHDADNTGTNSLQSTEDNATEAAAVVHASGNKRPAGTKQLGFQHGTNNSSMYSPVPVSAIKHAACGIVQAQQPAAAADFLQQLTKHAAGVMPSIFAAAPPLPAMQQAADGPRSSHDIIYKEQLAAMASAGLMGLDAPGFGTCNSLQRAAGYWSSMMQPQLHTMDHITIRNKSDDPQARPYDSAHAAGSFQLYRCMSESNDGSNSDSQYSACSAHAAAAAAAAGHGCCSIKVCSHCSKVEQKQWRKRGDGRLLCNRCFMWRRNHGGIELPALGVLSPISSPITAPTLKPIMTIAKKTNSPNSSPACSPSTRHRSRSLSHNTVNAAMLAGGGPSGALFISNDPYHSPGLALAEQGRGGSQPPSSCKSSSIPGSSGAVNSPHRRRASPETPNSVRSSARIQAHSPAAAPLLGNNFVSSMSNAKTDTGRTREDKLRQKSPGEKRSRDHDGKFSSGIAAAAAAAAAGHHSPQPQHSSEGGSYHNLGPAAAAQAAKGDRVPAYKRMRLSEDEQTALEVLADLLPNAAVMGGQHANVVMTAAEDCIGLQGCGGGMQDIAGAVLIDACNSSGEIDGASMFGNNDRTSDSSSLAGNGNIAMSVQGHLKQSQDALGEELVQDGFSGSVKQAVTAAIMCGVPAAAINVQEVQRSYQAMLRHVNQLTPAAQQLLASIAGQI